MYGVKPRALYKGSYNYSMDGDQISGLVFAELSCIHIHMHKKKSFISEAWVYFEIVRFFSGLYIIE